MFAVNAAYRTFGAGAFAFAVFALLGPHQAFALETLDPGAISNARADVSEGVVASVRPCYEPSGYAFTIGGTTANLIFRSSISNPYPSNAIPVVGQNVFAILGATTNCDTASGAAVSNVSGRSATYFSTSVLGSSPNPIPPASICPAIGFIQPSTPCTGTWTPTYTSNGCQIGWECGVVGSQPSPTPSGTAGSCVTPWGAQTVPNGGTIS